MNALRLRKRELYAIAGVVGGAIGAALAEFVLRQPNQTSNRIGDLLETGLWSSIFAGALGLTLYLAGAWHQHRELEPIGATQVLAMSAAAGFLAGAGAQYLFSLDIGSFRLQNYGFRILAWAIMGALLGLMLSRYIPNLGPIRGFGAGAVGGATGCMGFIITSLYLAGPAGRIMGIALLGLALGLAMYLVEDLFREASVEVEWAPYETTRVGLGTQPVTIGGGGEEHIFKKGLPPRVSSIVINEGSIEHIETANGRRTALHDGSRLRIGGLNLLIHASSDSSSQQTNKPPSLLLSVGVGAAVVAGAIALTLLAPVPQAGTNVTGDPGTITTLNQIGDSAKLDTSTPLTEVNIRLEWQAAVDLDLNAFYTMKSGDTGIVDYQEKDAPNMKLDNDAGVGDRGGKNEENLRISSLDDYQEVWFATKIFSKGGSYSDYDGRVTVETNNGDTIEVPLTSTETKPYLLIAKLTNGPEGPTITNLNDAVDCDELTRVLGRGECVDIQPKTSPPAPKLNGPR